MTQASINPQETQIFELALSMISETGLAGLTVREVSKRAGISPSGLVFRFGTHAAFLAELAAWLIRKDEAFWSELTERLDGPLGTSSLDVICKAIVTERALEHRTTILALWEFYLLSARSVEFQPLVALWRQQDIRFWQTLLRKKDVPVSLAETWAGGMLGCMRILALSERLACALIWVDDVMTRLHERIFRLPVSRPGDSPARADSEKAFPVTGGLPDDDASTRSRIIRAASEHILEDSCASLSHRAIAKRSGVSLSSTTHHFRSLKDILLASCDHIYAEARRPAETYPNSSRTYSKSEFIHDILPGLTGSQKQARASTVAMEDIMLTVSRHASARGMAPALLALTGGTMTRLISGIRNTERSYDRLDGHVLRLIIAGTMNGRDFTDLPSDQSPFTALLEAYL